MSDIYCGAKKTPKNKRLGTAEECAKAHQVRHYGIEAIDPQIIEQIIVDSLSVKKDEKELTKYTMSWTKQKIKDELIKKIK